MNSQTATASIMMLICTPLRPLPRRWSIRRPDLTGTRMEIATLVSVLDQPHLAAEHLHGWGLRMAHRAEQSLLELADSGLTLDLLAFASNWPSICRSSIRTPMPL